MGENPVDVAPTQGFNIKSLQHEGLKLNVWDIGGQKAIREYWSNYFEQCDALVYVVDSSDEGRMAESTQELNTLLQEEKLASVPVLIYANKQDLNTSLNAEAVTGSMALASITTRPWNIQACSAKNGEGMEPGLEWLVTQFSG